MKDKDLFLSFISKNDLDSLKNMIKNGFDPYFSSHGFEGYPLCLACEKGHEKIVQYFLNYIPANIADNYPLKISSEMGHLNCVKILLPLSNIESNPPSLSDIIYWSIYKKQDEVTRYLIQNTSVNLSLSPMIISIIKNHTQNIDLLFDRVDTQKVKEKIKSYNSKESGVSYFLNKLSPKDQKKPKSKKKFLLFK